jgi:MSHA biogenesis protein MshO
MSRYRVMGKSRGFTLIELVVVIILLGVMATFSSQFIGSSTQLYADASAREQLMSDVRFGVERLNREVRDVVPGSLVVSSDQQCVSFWPLAAVSRYVSLPTSASGTLSFLIPQSGSVKPEDYAIVYPVGLGASAPYNCTAGACSARVVSAPVAVNGDNNLLTVSLSQIPSGVFTGYAAPSPGARIFFARERVSYCRNSQNQLVRQSTTLVNSSSSSALMAEHLSSARFFQDPQAFNTSGELGIHLTFSQRGETVLFSHQVEVSNVP